MFKLNTEPKTPKIKHPEPEKKNVETFFITMFSGNFSEPQQQEFGSFPSHHKPMHGWSRVVY